MNDVTTNVMRASKIKCNLYKGSDSTVKCVISEWYQIYVLACMHCFALNRTIIVHTVS